MPRKSPNDIWIGEDDWIEFVTPKDGFANATYIDESLQPTLRFWKELETVCVKECCGIDAFDLSPDSITKTAKSGQDKDIATMLDRLRGEISHLNEDSVASSELNQCFQRDVFLKLLDHVIPLVKKALCDSSVS